MGRGQPHPCPRSWRPLDNGYRLIQTRGVVTADETEPAVQSDCERGQEPGQDLVPGSTRRQSRDLAVRLDRRADPAAFRDRQPDGGDDIQGARTGAREGLVAGMRQTYQAIAARDGRWWFVQVPGEQGLVTQVHRLDQAEPMLREVIGLMRKVPEDSFDVVIEPDLSSIGELRAVIERAVQERERAAAAQDSASAAIRDAVAQIRASGFTTRDAGALVGVSPQRISQLATTGQAGRAPRRAAELRAPYDVSR